ncbi:MAG: hypothetical protein HUU20_27075 [Pirellulales bacterium]|nr:hypothetical protein [Pirellulales bacterium]
MMRTPGGTIRARRMERAFTGFRWSVAAAQAVVVTGLPEPLEALVLRDSCLSRELTEAAQLLKAHFGDRARLD